jgi:hypothetical protein
MDRGVTITMTLDITKVASQVGDMANKIKSSNQERREHLKCAFDKLCDKNTNVESLKRKIADATLAGSRPV